jgi:hypothetical protein
VPTSEKVIKKGNDVKQLKAYKTQQHHALVFEIAVID